MNNRQRRRSKRDSSYTGSYPAAAKKFAHSFGVKSWSKAPILRGFWREAQRVHEKRICTSLPSSLRMAWKGVLNPRHFLGVRLAVMTMSWMTSSDTRSMSI